MSKRVTATARVQVTLEFHLTQPWGHDCTTGQVFEQAARQAVEDLQRLMSHRCNHAPSLPQATLIGQPKALCVLAQEGPEPNG